MCGISAFFATKETNVTSLVMMNNAIKHRGPDDEGFLVRRSGQMYTFGGADTPKNVYGYSLPYCPHTSITESNISAGDFVFGHRRLSIVDLSPAGHQPMCNQDRSTWIVYNGEVYNYLELKKELILMGYEFLTHSDTEVILAAYKQWGEGCLNRMNGMFSFVIYDQNKNQIFIARDRFGVKPLYYWISSHGLALASEIKQFTVLPGWEANLNGQRVYDFLNWGITDHTDETLFRSVFQLRGGTCFTLNLDELNKLVPGGKLDIKKWYYLKPKKFEGSLSDASRQFYKELYSSVGLRLRADVPIGSCLSGGLDSSSIVCVMNDQLKTKGATELQKTFSAVSHVKKYDESPFVQEVISATGADAHYVYPEVDQLFKINDQIVWHQDEPFGSTSIFAQWCVFESARKNAVKVMLDGQGADEQLAGYHSFFSSYLSGLLKSFQLLNFWREVRLLKNLHGYSLFTISKYVLDILLPNSVRQVLRKFLGKVSANPDWMNMALLGVQPLDPFHELGAKVSSVAEYSYSQLTASNLQMLLHWEDRDSMAHSVEARVPFLDYNLVEFVLGLPDSYKISEGTTKRVLREAMRGVLPEKIRTRVDKLGFVTPEEVWIKSSATEMFREEIKTAVENTQGVLNNNVLKIFEEMVAGRRPFNFFIWRVVSFSLWMRVFKVKV